jgi:hypothetical protein
MTEPSPPAAANGLTPELFGRIFSVTPQNRRRNRDIFEKFVPTNSISVDSEFYNYIFSAFNNSNIKFLAEYELKMHSLNISRQTFSVKAMRHLSKNTDFRFVSFAEYIKLDENILDNQPIERDVLRLLKRLHKHGFNKEEGLTAEEPESAAPSENWHSLAQQIESAAQALSDPDVDASKQILSLAKALVEACSRAAQKQDDEERIRNRAESLRGRCMALGKDPETGWPSVTPHEWLDALEGALIAAETARSEHEDAEGEQARLDREATAASQARDLDTLESLMPLRRENLTRVGETEERLASAKIAVWEMLSETLPYEIVPANRDEITQDDENLEPLSPDEDGETIVGTENDAGPETPIEPNDNFLFPSDEEGSKNVSLVLNLQSLNSDEFFSLSSVYLGRGDVVFAFHLARLCETNSGDAEALHKILTALVMLRCIGKGEDMADHRRNEAMAELSGAFSKAENQAAASRLALAALIRPALFDPDFGARGQLGSLPLEGSLSHYSTLADALAKLGHDVRLSIDILADLVGAERTPATPLAVEKLGRALQTWRSLKTTYQPAYRIFHQELEQEGKLGRVIYIALEGRPEARRQVDELLTDLDQNRAALESWILDAEKRAGRPPRLQIEGMAREWLCKRLQDVCDALKEWRNAYDHDSTRPQDNNRDKLLRATGTIRKALDELPETSPMEPDPLTSAAGRVLAAELDDLRNLLDGCSIRKVVTNPGGLFSLPLLLLPGGCQDLAEGSDNSFREERLQADQRLLEALRHPGAIATSTIDAFKMRLSEHAITTAKALLDQLCDEIGDEGSLRKLTQELDEACDLARQNARLRVDRLRQTFTTLSYLDTDTSSESRGVLARLAAISRALGAGNDDNVVRLPALPGLRSPEVPPDFPQLDVLLSALEAQRDKMRSTITDRQKTELQTLRMGATKQSAQTILDQLEKLDPVTVDDAIAELKAGRSVPLPGPEAKDAFEGFFPDFISELEKHGEQASRGRLISLAREGGHIGGINFSLPDSQGNKRAVQMLETWGTAENAMRQPARLPSALEALFAQIGFTGISLGKDRSISDQLRGLVMDCDVPRPSGWFLPPTFGSVANGRYQILVARDHAPLDVIRRQIADAPDASWIIVYFRRVSVQKRRDFALKLREEGRQALLLDESLYIYLCTQRDDLLPSFFACTLPFSWVQPYTTSAGKIPPEIFFGRRTEIEKIVSREASGCLIYGGRQLGKSALLYHIRHERHRPEHGEIAIYLDIKPLGGVGLPADNIWEELAHSLRSANGFESLKSEPNAVVEAIDSWLDGDPSRRVLAMFDEADNFLRSEHYKGYTNLQKLKNLMESTGRRFKAVFAGLHNVRRVAQAPNSPLPHLGDPICIGPMNQSAENRAALRRLAIEPMRAAGLKYTEPALADDMLARMNYYPSLVQIFGKQIVEGLGRRPVPGATGPHWSLDRSSLFEGESAEKIAEQIRDRFQLTLNLDRRYECIAKSIALHRLDTASGDTQVLSRGLKAAEIHKITLWPRHLEPPATADLEALLGEMVDLGVLGAFPDGRYGLRNAQIAQMLGERDALEDELFSLQERDEEPSYDATVFHSVLRPKFPNVRAPLPDSALNRLFSFTNPGIRAVLGTSSVIGSDFANRIKCAAEIWHDGPTQIVKADRDQIRSALEKSRSKKTVLVIDGPWSPALAGDLARYPQVVSGQVLPVWCLDRHSNTLKVSFVFYAGAWLEPMVSHWLMDEGFGSLNDSQTREIILEISGGAPARLFALRPLLADLVTAPLAERPLRLRDWGENNPFPADALSLERDYLNTLKFLEENEVLFETKADFFELLSTEQINYVTQERLELLSALGLVAGVMLADRPPKITPLGRLALG